jgi:HPt (histidine-containing phosphotransfer) domain-containing protein
MDASLLQRIDFLRLSINLGGNKKTIRQMLEMFLSSTAASLKRMEKAEAEANILVWLQVAHQLKGASKNITAKRLAVLCEEAEVIQEFPHPQSANVIYNMHKELALLRTAIEKHLRDLEPML